MEILIKKSQSSPINFMIGQDVNSLVKFDSFCDLKGPPLQDHIFENRFLLKTIVISTKNDIFFHFFSQDFTKCLRHFKSTTRALTKFAMPKRKTQNHLLFIEGYTINPQLYNLLQKENLMWLEILQWKFMFLGLKVV